MSEESTTRFAKLNDANYASWSIMMEAELTQKDLWTNMVVILLDVDKKTNNKQKAEFEKKKGKRKYDKMAQARAEMILRVEAGQLSHMTARDPMEIWKRLKNVHRGQGFATSLALKWQFLMSKKGQNQTMQAWIGKIQAQALKMEMAEVKVSKQDVILALTLGLPPTYNAIIISFDAMDPKKLTIDTVITRLLNEETCQSGIHSHTPTPAHTSHTANDEALVVAHTSRRPLSDITCFFCTKKGHFHSDCPDRKAWEKSKASGDEHVAYAESDWAADGVWSDGEDVAV